MNTLTATQADVQRWRDEERVDILMWCELIGEEPQPWGDLWVDQIGEREVKRCPFVRKKRGKDQYVCTIYETRPEVCRTYPLSVEVMETVSCDMLEPGDTDDDVARFMARTSGEA